MALRTSMVGSSLKTLDSNGEALIRSPAPTKKDAVAPSPRVNSAAAAATVAAMCAAPPTIGDVVVRRRCWP